MSEKPNNSIGFMATEGLAGLVDGAFALHITPTIGRKCFGNNAWRDRIRLRSKYYKSAALVGASTLTAIAASEIVNDDYVRAGVILAINGCSGLYELGRFYAEYLFPSDNDT